MAMPAQYTQPCEYGWKNPFGARPLPDSLGPGRGGTCAEYRSGYFVLPVALGG